MSIKFETFKTGGGAGTDTLDDVTSRGASTTNAITVGGVTVGTEYSLPAADGSPNQFLKTDGAGSLSFAALDVTGGLVYQGAFNATAGTPSIANAEKGDFYVIDTAGTIYGQDWNVGDHLLINEDMGGSITNSKIDKIDNTETPASETVAGVIEIATNAEATAASETNKALVPSNISSIALSSFNDDLSYLSSGDNVSLLTNDAGYLTDITGENLGDLSDVTISSVVNAQVLQYDSGSSAWINATISTGGLAAVVDDTTPQLGGSLDVNGHEITSASSGNVVINPDGTGDISIGADLIPDADATHTIGDEDNRYISYYGDMNGAIRFKAKNDQGTTINKGQVVYISGVSGTVPQVRLARANSAATMPAFGLAFASANDQADIEIVTFGNLTDYDTTTYSLSANDTVFVSAATAGALTNSAPTSETNLIQNIGRVVRADASAGIIKVGGAGRSNATPNLNQDKIFLGNASNQAVSTALSSIALSSFNDDLSYLSSGDNVSLLTNDAGYLTSVSSASETVEGIIETATNAEATAATANNKALVPSNISSIALSSFNDDLSYLSSGDNISLLTNDSGYITSVVDDTTPQLGGSLDTNNNEIITASNRNIILRPNGIGAVHLGGNTNPAELRLYCESADAHYVGLKSPTHTELSGSQIWRLPTADGTTGQAMTTDGSGNLSFSTISGGGGFTYSAITADPANAQANYHYSATGTFTITLPTSGMTAGEEIRIKNMGTGTITVDPQTSTIDGSTTDYTLDVQYSAITLVSTGTNWEII
jgi:hypothetical protein